VLIVIKDGAVDVQGHEFRRPTVGPPAWAGEIVVCHPQSLTVPRLPPEVGQWRRESTSCELFPRLISAAAGFGIPFGRFSRPHRDLIGSRSDRPIP
jgi:hypothetical protein